MSNINWKGIIIQNDDNIYIPICNLGEGSYASVWSCYHKNSKEFYAIKIFKKSERISGTNEIDIYNKFESLKIRHVIKIFDHFVHDGHVCIVMELMIGSTYDILKYGINANSSTNYNFNNGFHIDFVIKTIYIILESLSDLHSRKIIHGDIKPENILLYGKTKGQKELLTLLTRKSLNKKIIGIINKVDTYRYDSADSSSSTENSSCHSEMSPMSDDPDLIVFTDDDGDIVDIDDDDFDTYCDDDAYSKQKFVDIDESYIKNPQIKLADMGSTVDLSTAKKLKNVQTKYYRSPEIIMGLEYNETCDIWALGCTMYELLTGDILFDPDDYNGVDSKRCILSMIYYRLGNFPIESIQMSPLKQVFFDSHSRLKTNIDDDPNTHIWLTLLEHLKCDTPSSREIGLLSKCDTIKKYLIVDLLFQMLNTDHKKRITSELALQHPLFNLYINKI